MTTIDQKVYKGSLWLDENYPTWLDEIDLDNFNMGASGQCVCSQVTGKEWYQFADAWRTEHGSAFWIENGFLVDESTPGYDLEYDRLTEAWLVLIRNRRQSLTVNTAAKDTVDSLMLKYAEKLQGIYDDRSAGDYTFLGVLAAYSMHLKDEGLTL